MGTRIPPWTSTNPLASHDFERLETEGFVHFSCRRCSREFRCDTQRIAAWAVNGDGKALEDRISQRWLGEACPGTPQTRDPSDRARLK